MSQDAYVSIRCADIEDRLRYAARKSADDPDLGAYLADYISVLISGVVEDCIEHLVVLRARKANDPHLEEFVRSSIDIQFRNPRSQDIANVLRRFGDDYRSSYSASVSQEAREALGSIVHNRMALAHVGQTQSHFTVNEIRRYFELIVGILEVVEGILLSDSTGPSLQEPAT